jgi:hypothetical protein
LVTADEMLLILLLKDKFHNGEESSTITEHAGLWIGFCLDEFSIYSKYDQFTITIACILLTYEQLEIQIKNFGINLLPEEINLIKSCVDSIKQVYIQSESIEHEADNKENIIALEETDICELTEMNGSDLLSFSDSFVEINMDYNLVINETNETMLLTYKQVKSVSKRIKLKKNKRNLKLI